MFRRDGSSALDACLIRVSVVATGRTGEFDTEDLFNETIHQMRNDAEVIDRIYESQSLQELGAQFKRSPFSSHDEYFDFMAEGGHRMGNIELIVLSKILNATYRVHSTNSIRRIQLEQDRSLFTYYITAHTTCCCESDDSQIALQ